MLTNNWTRGKQPASTPPPQSTTTGLHTVNIHQMAPSERTSDCSALLMYRPRKDERLRWPSWPTCSGRFTHITGHPSAASLAQDRERSTIVTRHQPNGRRTDVRTADLKHISSGLESSMTEAKCIYQVYTICRMYYCLNVSAKISFASQVN